MMKRRTLIFCAALALFGQAFCGPLEIRFEADKRLDSSIFEAREISAEPFARAALLAGGSSEKEIEERMEELDSLWEKLDARLEPIAGAEERADAILFFIHEEILSKYNFYQTRVDEALESGVYNCVSSAILFWYFAKRAAIPVCACETPRHAFCMIFDENGGIDVETTNPYGVNPGKKRGQDLGGGKKQWITVPAKDYAGRRQVDDRRVIGMVYNNLIVQLQKKKQNAQSVGLAVDAYEVQGRSNASRNDLEICVLNAAGDLSAAGKEEEALELVLKARETFGPSPNWEKRLKVSRHNLALANVNRLPFEEALEAVDKDRESLGEESFAELKEYAYLLNEQKLSKKSDWPGALKIIKMGLEEFPKSQKLLRHQSILMQNYAIDFHNEAADLYNAGKTEEAVAAVRRGLEAVPGNKILLGDLEKMSRAR